MFFTGTAHKHLGVTIALHLQIQVGQTLHSLPPQLFYHAFNFSFPHSGFPIPIPCVLKRMRIFSEHKSKPAYQSLTILPFEWSSHNPFPQFLLSQCQPPQSSTKYLCCESKYSAVDQRGDFVKKLNHKSFRVQISNYFSWIIRSFTKTCAFS